METMRNLSENSPPGLCDYMQPLFDTEMLLNQNIGDGGNLPSYQWEQFDTCLKQLDEQMLSRVIDNLVNVKSKIGDLRNDREKKRCDVEYYQDWSIQDIGHWIDSIENGKFSEYSQELIDGMEKHDLTAADIKDINQLGLKLLGVARSDEKQRSCLAQYLQNIDEKQNMLQEENVVFDKEYSGEKIY